MNTPDPGYLNHLYEIVQERKGGNPKESYIAKVFAKGRKKIAQKMGEEAVEVVVAALVEEREQVISESADLLFHWLLLLADTGVTPQEVFAEMQRREGISGLTEKANRKE